MAITSQDFRISTLISPRRTAATETPLCIVSRALIQHPGWQPTATYQVTVTTVSWQSLTLTLFSPAHLHTSRALHNSERLNFHLRSVWIWGIFFTSAESEKKILHLRDESQDCCSSEHVNNVQRFSILNLKLGLTTVWTTWTHSITGITAGMQIAAKEKNNNPFLKECDAK